MRKLKILMVLLLVLTLTTSCATMSDQGRTKAEGAGLGALVGAGVGALIGGGRGAAIGAAVGAGAGYLVGNEVAKRKQKYANTEDFLNAEIASTQEYNRTAVAYNTKLSREVAQLDRESKALRASYDKGKADKKTLTTKSAGLQKKINDTKKLEETLSKELEVQTAILEDGKKTRPANDQHIASLEKEVKTLQQNLDQLRSGSKQLASIDQRLSV